MAANLNNSGRTRGGSRRAFRPQSDINVTPLVDVMLVLLVVFMITAPLMTVGVPVDLPKTAAAPLPVDKDPLFVTVQTDGRVYVQDSEVSIYTLVPVLVAATNSNPEARILVRGDQKIAYGRIMEVMGTISLAGFRKIGLVAQTPERTGSPAAAGTPPKPGNRR